MKKRRVIIILGGILLVLLAIGGIVFYQFAQSGFTSESYQHDADIVRLKDIKVFGDYIREFHQKTRKYPLEGKSDQPNYVHLATEEQQQQIRGSPDSTHVVTSLSEFLEELETGLGRKITIPFDPQRVAVNKPNFYIYMIRGKIYYFAVHLHQAFPFARKIAPHYYKLEISNQPNPTNQIWEYDALTQNGEFIAAISRQMNKPGYFQHIRNEQNASSQPSN
jgi:hypothetical protein